MNLGMKVIPAYKPLTRSDGCALVNVVSPEEAAETLKVSALTH